MFLMNRITVFAAALLFGALTASVRADVDCDIFGPFSIENRVVGACCEGTECVLTTEEACDEGTGGYYLGDGTDCTGDPCAHGACCLPDDTCVTHLSQEDCEMQGGAFEGYGTRCACAFTTVPAVSEIGLVALVALLLGAGGLVIARRRSVAV